MKLSYFLSFVVVVVVVKFSIYLNRRVFVMLFLTSDFLILTSDSILTSDFYLLTLEF